MNKVLVIGSGGREHTIAWKLSASKKVDKVYIAPGNPGMVLTPKCELINITDQKKLLYFAKKNKISLTVVGPEVPLINGIVDLFQRNKLKIFGPHKKAAMLEGSKDFCKKFMIKHKIPTASYQTFTNSQKAINYLKKVEFPIVIKCDGLAAGKGVNICQNYQEAKNTIDQFLVKNIFNIKNNKIVIEQYLEGIEASIICLVDKKTIVPLVSAKDYKQVFDNNKGPNTGGMGAICPNPYYTKKHEKIFKKEILTNTIKGLKKDKLSFNGFLFFGLMLTKKGPKVLEFNMRMGDPETQSILPLLNTDFYDLLNASLNNKLSNTKINFSKKKSMNVVLISKGYPVSFKKNLPIKISKNIRSNIFYSGVSKKDNIFYTNGGRVMSIQTIENSFNECSKKIYSDIQKISYSNKSFRSDIGKI